MRRVLLACSTLALVLAGHSAALAKPDGPSASAHSHDSGFFMRLAVGAGYHKTSTEAGFGDTSLRACESFPIHHLGAHAPR